MGKPVHVSAVRPLCYASPHADLHWGSLQPGGPPGTLMPQRYGMEAGCPNACACSGSTMRHPRLLMNSDSPAGGSNGQIRSATNHEPGSDEPIVAPLIFETSWEVCSQAGGIYTVLRSKAPAEVQRRGDGYVLIGPYHEAARKSSSSPRPLRASSAKSSRTSGTVESRSTPAAGWSPAGPRSS